MAQYCDGGGTTPGHCSAIMMMNCAQIGTTQQLRGTLFGPSYYMSVNRPSGSVGSNNGNSDIVWLVPTKIMVGGIGATVIVNEPDLFEDPYGKGTHDWSLSGSTVNYNNSYIWGTVATPPVTYGALAVPAALNNGTTALIKQYVNGVEEAAGACSGTAGAPALCNGQTATIGPGNPNGTFFTALNSEQYCMAMSGNLTTPLVLGEIQVWTR
jgi:hypothetical protein